MSFKLLITILVANISAVLCWYPKESRLWVPGLQSYHGVHDGSERARFAEEWTVLVEGGEDVAQLVALERGYQYGGPVIGFADTYSFKRYPHSKQRRNPTEHAHILTKDRRVRWADPLYEKLRVKRYSTSDSDAVIYREKRIEASNGNVTNGGGRRKRSAHNPMFNDELWSQQWYLQDTRKKAELPRLDLNVLPAYAMGFTGKGIRVSVLDDGIEYNHTDLRANYDAEISWDSNGRDNDPFPRYEEPMRNAHGTRCAGEIAMIANNLKCGVGVAWGTKVGGVRMLDGQITDRIEGEAIGYAYDKVDIYSASWGPNDDGRTVEGPGRLALQAFKRGIDEGRGGKGNIYVWANGNGGANYDNCNCDGYSASIYTISIGSASQHGLFPWYGEICSSTLATAYSSGAYEDQKIATTDTGDSCTLSHTGTSAAAPLAAGIIALTLEANSNLIWRDVQHLIVWTSEYIPLSANDGWQINGAGFRFDVRFGFGLLNAGALVLSALNWTTVPPKHICRVESTPPPQLSSDDVVIRSGHPVKINVKVKDCVVNYLEHVELIINVHYSRRGALEVLLQSPQGTKVQVLSARPKDTSNAGFMNWPLTSVATWGENPNGIWTVVIQDKTDENNFGLVGPLSLILHGTNEIPNHMKDGPRKYNEDYNLKHELDYFENFVGNDLDTSNEANTVVESPEKTNTNEFDLNEVDSNLLDQVEHVLQRFHHRMNLV